VWYDDEDMTGSKTVQCEDPTRAIAPTGTRYIEVQRKNGDIWTAVPNLKQNINDPAAANVRAYFSTMKIRGERDYRLVSYFIPNNSKEPIEFDVLETLYVYAPIVKNSDIRRWHIHYKDGDIYNVKRGMTEGQLLEMLNIGYKIEECTEERCWDCYRYEVSPKKPIAEAGKILLVTSGQYSDYHVEAILRALVDIDLEKYDLVDWMKMKEEGLLEQVDYYEVYD